jgi:peptidoglycan hydrolase CwlO-like protein
MARLAAVFLIVLFALATARAQDIAGIEDCSKTSGLDKRTGCFQSNVDFLKKLITKSTGDLQQKLSAATAEIGELKRANAVLQNSIAEMQANVARLQASVQQLREPPKKPDGGDKK